MNRDPLSSDAPPVSLRVLLLEDRAVDAELLVHALRRDGFAPQPHQVETEADFLAALDPALDVIIADYALPNWSGLAALEAVRASGFDIPVLIVSGVVGDESAAAVMQRGAADFLLKDRLARLGDAVRRALQEARLRRDQLAALESLRITHAQMAQLLEHNPAVLYVLRGGHPYTPGVIGDSVIRLLGFAPVEIQTPDWWLNQLHPEDRERVRHSVDTAFATGASRLEYRLRHKAGHYCWIDDVRRLTPGPNGEPGELVGVWLDITERKRAEAERERLLAELQTAQSTVRTLSGLLPICASCKHIRDERGAWQQIETYIRDRSQADFTHSMCPDCVHKFYPDLAGLVLSKPGASSP